MLVLSVLAGGDRALGGLLLPLRAPGGQRGEQPGSTSSTSYEESCRQWNADHPEQYTDREQCAADAEEMAEDLVDYLETHQGG